MKKTLKKALAFVLVAVCLLGIVSCGKKIDATGLWKDAKYLKDTTVGKGEKTVLLDIEAGEQSITLTVKTDKETLGEALYELGIINDASFFDTANGIKADYNADRAYWGYYQGEKYMMYGVNDTKISGGEHFRFVYSIYGG